MAVIQANRVMQDEQDRLPHEEKYQAGAVFANGQYCSLAEAMMPLLDMGFLQSDATYEKATASKGRYFSMQDHFDRCARSCAKFRLQNPYTNEQMLAIFNKMHRLTGVKLHNLYWEKMWEGWKGTPIDYS